MDLEQIRDMLRSGVSGPVEGAKDTKPEPLLKSELENNQLIQAATLERKFTKGRNSRVIRRITLEVRWMEKGERWALLSKMWSYTSEMAARDIRAREVRPATSLLCSSRQLEKIKNTARHHINVWITSGYNVVSSTFGEYNG